MRLRDTFSIALVVASLLIAGCPQDDTSSDPPNDPDSGAPTDVTVDGDGDPAIDTRSADGDSVDLTLAEFVNQFSELTQTFFCKSRWACPRRIPISGISYVTNYRDEQSCTQGRFVSLTVGRSIITPELRQDINAGLATFDAQAAASCLNELRSVIDGRITNCEQSIYSSFGSTCSKTRIFEGQVALGDTCRSDYACSGEPRVCNRSDNACQGTCAEPAFGSSSDLSEGDNCTDDEQCGDGLTCAPTSTSGDTSTCVPLSSRNAGQPCSTTRECVVNTVCTNGGLCAQVNLRSQGQTCTTAAQICEPGLVCAYHNSDDLNCQPPAPEGASCDFDDGECIGTLACVNEECTAAKQGGEICQGPAECLSDSCNDRTCAPFQQSPCR
jgi:hypothetical protein